MVELALSIAILAFALVAIIGVLPTGLQVQKTNREDTLINQDALYLLEAIKSGSQGLQDLTNYVDWITVSNLNTRSGTTYRQGPLDGRSIVGLLTTPKYIPVNRSIVTNRVSAKIRSLGGSAVEKSTRTRDIAFSYLLTSEVIPFEAFPSLLTNFTASAISPEDKFMRSNRWAMAGALADNAYEVRLILRWPLLPNGDVGNNRQSFRTFVSKRIGLIVTNNTFLYFFTNNPASPHF